jgi:hypothetical protein
MISARPAFQLELRASDHYLVLLGGALLGYAVLGKYFAYLGIPPLFVGEIVLLTGFAVALRTGCLVAALAALPSLLLAIAMIWVMLRTLPYLGEHGFNALRDSVVVMYGGFSFIVMALLIEDGRRVATLLKYYSSFLAIFIPLSPIMFAAAFYSGFGVYFIRPGEVTAHLVGATVFALVKFRRMSPLAIVALLATLVMAITISRGAMMTYFVPVVVALLLLGKARQLSIAIVAGLVIIGAAYALETAFTDSQIAKRHSTDRSLSVRQIVENVTSIVGKSGDQTEGTKVWRLEWWNIIIEDTIYGPHFWTGRGFGLNLADADGFWDGAHPDAPPLRSPHNAHMTMLSRAGVPGAVLWGAIAISWMGLLGKTMLTARRCGQRQWANLFLFAICYVLAILINASFDVVLEAPMQGIWFWCLFGFGVGSVMVYRAQPIEVRQP